MENDDGKEQPRASTAVCVPLLSFLFCGSLFLFLINLIGCVEREEKITVKIYESSYV